MVVDMIYLQIKGIYIELIYHWIDNFVIDIPSITGEYVREMDLLPLIVLKMGVFVFSNKTLASTVFKNCINSSKDVTFCPIFLAKSNLEINSLYNKKNRRRPALKSNFL